MQSAEACNNIKSQAYDNIKSHAQPFGQTGTKWGMGIRNPQCQHSEPRDITGGGLLEGVTAPEPNSPASRPEAQGPRCGLGARQRESSPTGCAATPGPKSFAERRSLRTRNDSEQVRRK